MFLGHFAVALAAKKAAPKTSLGTLVFAAQFADMLWPLLLLLGSSRSESCRDFSQLLHSISYHTQYRIAWLRS